MRLLIEDRVEQALRHLQPSEAKKIEHVIFSLEAESFETFRHRFQIYKLSIPNEQVFVLRATQRLRILFKYGEDQTIIIEDIVSHETLEKHFSGRQR
jgi:mRNA-degrading endonuclease RelE of RelBE toxin-antitoxin system